MDIECNYHAYKTYGYTCVAENQTIPVDTKLKFIGKHLNGKTNNDVKNIQFNHCIVSKVPQRLTEIFPNLLGMQIWNSGLKDINRSDLLEYKNFKLLSFTNNDIEYLPGDLFADCRKLEKIVFAGNPLTTVEPNILDGLEHLKYVNMNGKHFNYGLIDSKSTISRDDLKLVEMKVKFYEEFMKDANSQLKTDYVKKLCSDKEELTKLKFFFQNNETLKDIRISIDKKQFLVHKTFLAARSPTLAEILSNNPVTENLNLVGISVDIFEDILKFLYTDELPKEVDFLQLFATAGRLKIEELKKYASEKILEQLDHENAPEVLNLGSKYKHDIMKRKAFEKIKQKYPKIDFKEEWLNKDEKIEEMVERLQKIQKMEKELVDSMECED